MKNISLKIQRNNLTNYTNNSKLIFFSLICSLFITATSKAEVYKSSILLAQADVQKNINANNPSTLQFGNLLNATTNTLQKVENSPEKNIQNNNRTTEKVNIEYRDALLVDVIRYLAESAKINLALSPDLANNTTSKVSVRLTDVTYDVALRTILNLFQLGAVVENDILRIDSLSNLKKERKDKSDEKKNRMLAEPLRVLVWQVNYAKAKDLKALLLEQMKSNFNAEGSSMLNISSDDRSNKLIIEGIPESLIRAKTLLENLDKRKQQVMIEARIVEASNDLSKTLSITWGTRFGFDGARGLSTGLIFPNSISGHLGGAGLGAAGALGANAPADVGLGKAQLGTLGFTLGSINGMVNIDGILRAYETESLANVVVAPRIIVQDQEPANIAETITTSRPIVSSDGEMVDRTFTSQIKLDVTPQITSDNSLELKINVNRDTPMSSASDQVQTKIGRAANTKLIVNNGDTAVIGGLYQTMRKKGTARVPLLGRLPIIGFLFRANDEQYMRSEMMVLITSRILANGENGSEAQFNSQSTIDNSGHFNSSSGNFSKNNKNTNSGMLLNENLKPANTLLSSNPSAGNSVTNSSATTEIVNSTNIPSEAPLNNSSVIKPTEGESTADDVSFN